MGGRSDVLNLFHQNEVIKICAPMVRYSKLEFRSLVRKYGCQLCFTPMIIADSFIVSEKARQNEFTTNKGDTPLVVQFAARTVDEFIGASELVAPHCDGVDLNCGCPQRWAMKDGYGADLLSHPEKMRDMVRQLRNRIPQPFTVSVKMRLTEDLRASVELCRQLEAAGSSFLTIHGRTPKQRTEPVNLEGIRQIVDSVGIPVIANGDIKSLSEVRRVHEETGCAGAMSARGLLQNPAMFTGEPLTPTTCVQDWVEACLSAGTPFQCFHHHLVFMLERVLSRAERRTFNCLTSVEAVIDFLVKCLGLKRPRAPPDTRALKSEIFFKDPSLDDGSYFKSRLKDRGEHNGAFEDYLDGSCFVTF